MWSVDELWAWLRQVAGPDAPGDLGLSPEDLRDLGESAQRISHDYPLSAPEVILVTLGRLLYRQVPIRSLRGSALAPGVGELCFADGTVIAVRAEHHGDLGRVAVRLLNGRVPLSGYQIAPGEVTLEVDFDGHRTRLHALAVSQPR